MTLNLLLDLDDTLLGNKIDTFVPVYSRKLGEHFAPFADPDKVVKMLLYATGEMVKNQQPDQTLEESFDKVFYPALGLERAKVQGAIDTFYKQIFPTFKELTQPIEGAIDLVKTSFERGYRVAIATNPLFPRTAILQRLAWARLNPDEYPFALIPSFESFHFAKPNPALYAELLAQMGWPDGPVVMVGDDLDLDISGARRLGMCAFWIAQTGKQPPTDERAPTAKGSQGEVLPWIDSLPEAKLLLEFSTPSAMLAILRATPAALDTLIRQKPYEKIQQRPQAGEWSAGEIICHLRDVEIEVYLPRVRKVISEINPFLPGVDTDPWATERNYVSQDPKDALHSFVNARMELITMLKSLDPTGWDRQARHAIIGPTSLRELVNILLSHDRLHIQQIHQTV